MFPLRHFVFGCFFHKRQLTFNHQTLYSESITLACNSYTGTWPYHATSNDDTIGTNDNIEAEAATHFYIDDNYYDKEPPKL